MKKSHLGWIALGVVVVLIVAYKMNWLGTPAVVNAAGVITTPATGLNAYI
jgi:uncharacterized membrane protein (DUF485 family)